MHPSSAKPAFADTFFVFLNFRRKNPAKHATYSLRERVFADMLCLGAMYRLEF